MNRLTCDVLVIGSGPAGLAAAYQARQHGAARVMVIERNREPGGILPQCIHNGFGLRVFQSDLTGPEYASRWIEKARNAGVEFLARTMVLAIDEGPSVVATSSETGLLRVEARAPGAGHGLSREIAWRAGHTGHAAGRGLYRRHGSEVGQHRGVHARQSLRHPGVGRHRHDHGPTVDH